MKVNIIGCGPAGQYFAILLKRQNPRHDITIIERDGPDDTFGWGIVFSDQTFSYLEDNDKESFTRIMANCMIWDNVDIAHRGRKISVRGNGFSGIGRLRFLNILHERCRELGVKLQFHTNVTDLTEYRDCDLLVGADGVNSQVRREFAEYFQPSLDVRKNKYIWLGTPRIFNGLTLTFLRNEAGCFAAHSYKFSPTTSTFIVECGEETWRKAGFSDLDEAATCAYLAELFRADLGGKPLLANNFVRWLKFPIVKNAHWRHENVVLLGDALHTAHFSIGSGTKLALEDAIALADCCKKTADVSGALALFEETRRPIVEKIQAAAESSLLAFENMEELMELEPVPFAYHMMTRSKKVTYESLQRRDPAFIALYDEWRGS
jgi:anthraniloyl-CoA monooxygenase